MSLYSFFINEFKYITVYSKTPECLILEEKFIATNHRPNSREANYKLFFFTMIALESILTTGQLCSPCPPAHGNACILITRSALLTAGLDCDLLFA